MGGSNGIGIGCNKVFPKKKSLAYIYLISYNWVEAKLLIKFNNINQGTNSVNQY